jgi:hypothetical protein
MTSRGGRLLGVLLAVAVVLSVAPGPALAQDTGDVDIDRLVEVYNANVDQAPDIVRGQLAGQEIELRIGDGSTVAGVDTGAVYSFRLRDDGTVADGYGEGEADDPAYRVRTSEDVFFDVLESETPAEAAATFDRHYEAGRIKVNGVGVTNAVRVEAVKFAVWAGKTFGLF